MNDKVLKRSGEYWSGFFMIVTLRLSAFSPQR